MDRHLLILIIVIAALGAVHWYLLTHITFEMIAKQPPRKKIDVYIFFAALVLFVLILLVVFSVMSMFSPVILDVA